MGMNGENETGKYLTGGDLSGKDKKKRKLNTKGKLVLCGFGTFVVGAAVIAGSCFSMLDKKDQDNLKKEVILEAGSRIRIEDFFSDCPEDARFVTDISDIDTNIPAVYLLTVSYEKAFTEDVTLKIEDHTGPKGKAVSQTVYTTWKMPEAEECVDNLYDLSGIAKVEYKNSTPKFTSGGTFDVPVVATDMYGNDTKIEVPFMVIDDRTAPVIEGVHDINAEGDARKLNLLDGIVVYDDYDMDPVIKVNDSMVNYNKTGEYEIIYSAVDKAGNVSSAKAMFNIKVSDSEKKTGSDGNGQSYSSGGSDYSDYSDSDSSSDPAYALAEKVMSSLWRDSDVETARAIFTWVHSNISYLTINEYMTYEEAAYRGFTRRTGDCYVYFSCAKMLLDCAGIPNLMVERFPVYSNGHYWNLVKLNGEWYHCDATVFRDHPDLYFMCTDEEIDDSHHSFNGALYPERAGGSTSYLATPTPTPKVTATPTPTATPVPTATPEPTATPTPTPPDIAEPTTTPEPTATPVPSTEPVVITEPEEPVVVATEPDYSGPAEAQPGEVTNLMFEPYGYSEEDRT
jgi:hypothetical protein